MAKAGMQAATSWAGPHKNTAGGAGMNRPSVTRSQTTALPLRHCLYLGLALLLTLAAGQIYYSWRTSRLAEQVAAQTALLAQIQANRANTLDRKSTRLNSSHVKISYAVFCLKKKKKQ